jgi:hypothetical protein
VIFIAHPPTPDPRWRDDITNSSVTSASGTKRTSARACVMSASDAKRTLDFLG